MAAAVAVVDEAAVAVVAEGAAAVLHAGAVAEVVEVAANEVSRSQARRGEKNQGRTPPFSPKLLRFPSLNALNDDMPRVPDRDLGCLAPHRTASMFGTFSPADKLKKLLYLYTCSAAQRKGNRKTSIQGEWERDSLGL